MEESFSQYESIVSKYKRIDRIVIASVAILVSISFLAGCILYITESINANRVRLSIYYWTLFAVSILIVILSRLLYDKFVLGKKHKLREITKSVGWGFDDTNQSCVLNSPYPTIFFKLDLPYSTAEVITVPNKPSDIYLLHCKYTPKSKKYSSIINTTVATIELNNYFPQIVLDSRKGTIFTSDLPVCFDPSQIIEVEGNFSKYFDIYAPDGYGIEVLDILSPDLMALMIDNSSMFDIEIFGNRVYIRSREDCFDNPEKLRLIYKATQIILTNIYEEGRHWSFAVQPKNPPTLKYYPSEESIKLGNKRFSSGLLVIPLFTVLITFTFGGVSLFNLKTLAISLSIGITLMIIYRYLFRKPEQQKWK